MKWIKVSDQLPPDDTEVIFVNGKNEVCVGRSLDNDPNTEKWATKSTIYFSDSILCEWAVCKYWMPLPKPPGD